VGNGAVCAKAGAGPAAEVMMIEPTASAAQKDVFCT
jgi:hypothetical protein